MAYPEGEVMVPVEGFAGVDEGELGAGDEVVQLGEVAEGAARLAWPSGAGWVLPLLLGGAVGAGLMYLGTSKDGGGGDDDGSVW